MSDSERGCILPILQACAVGVFAGLLTLAACMVKEWDAWYALGVGALAALLMFTSGVSAWRASEFIPYTPPRPPQPDKVRVEMVKPLDGGRQTQLAELPVSYDQLRELADGIARGAPLSENAWSGPGRPFTRSEFGALRGVLISRGWAVWRREGSPGQGIELTSSGRAIVRYFANDVTSPLPQVGND